MNLYFFNKGGYIIMGFRTIFSGNNTYLICTLGRKDKISYTQLDMFKNEAYKVFHYS